MLPAHDLAVVVRLPFDHELAYDCALCSGNNSSSVVKTIISLVRVGYGQEIDNVSI